MLLLSALGLGVLSLSLLVSTAPTFTPVQPPSYPLAVRNPYLSAWLPGNETANLPSAVPQFWAGQLLTWSVMAKVDGQAYSLFGVPSPDENVHAGSVLSADYTFTHTVFVVTAGSASFILDFFSPISPEDYVRQSLPFSYLTISASFFDGESSSVQIYSDIDNSWTDQFGTDVITEWAYATTEQNTQVFTLTPGGTATYSEVSDMAQWGTAVYCTRPNQSNLGSQVGDVGSTRADFAANGSLSGPWSWEPGSVVAYSQDLGSVGGPSSAKNITFVIGYFREASVNYFGSARTDYWRSSCADINCGCVHALDDFDSAAAESWSLDASIASKATAMAGSNYSDLVTLSMRQAFGAIDITIPLDTLNTSDVMVFMKEISSDGNVNTMDVIYPTSPIFYVMAPEYIRLLLGPVLQYLETGAWPHNYTIHDIGSSYPNATGHNNGTDEEMPVEECGNLLILAYMYQLASGNTAWANQYVTLFRSYANYLVVNGLYPTDQLSTDDGAGSVANQTGLAIKSAIALNAYGVMSGETNYSTIGKQFATTLYSDSVGTDSKRTHFTLIQGEGSSWDLASNLYADILLRLNTFPSAAYAMQSSYYSSVRCPAGVALDSALDWGKTDWMIWAAATAMAPGVGDTNARDMFVNDIHAFMTNGLNAVPLSDKFFVESNASDVQGVFDGYMARPVVGGHFGLLALDGPNRFSVGSSRRSISPRAWAMRLCPKWLKPLL